MAFCYILFYCSAFLVCWFENMMLAIVSSKKLLNNYVPIEKSRTKIKILIGYWLALPSSGWLLPALGDFEWLWLSLAGPDVIYRLVIPDSKLSGLRNLNQNLQYSFSNNINRNTCWGISYLIDTKFYVCLKNKNSQSTFYYNVNSVNCQIT